MAAPEGFTGVAYNQATESENRIHADDVARRFGFRGGLVPGVTVYAYLVEPAIRAFGRAFLEGGTARAVLRRPVYDGSRFRVDVKPDGERAYDAQLVDPEEVDCAEAQVALAAEPERLPRRRGDAPVPPADARPPATRQVLEGLREGGMGSLALRWEARGELDRTYRTWDPMPDLIRPDRGGMANPAFLLGLANWVLSRNVRLGPWIHVESRVRHLAAVPLGSELVTEARVTDLFARGGHEFVDLDVAVFLGADARPALHAEHRAIYRLREG